MKPKQWQTLSKPREKAYALGIESLSDSELLAIVLRTGNKGQSCLQLASDILNKCKGLTGLLRLSIKEMMTIKGIGLAKATELAATLEIIKRQDYQTVIESEVIDQPSKLINWLKHFIGNQDQEYFVVVSLDTRNQVSGYQILSKGGNNAVTISPNEIFRQALKDKAKRLIIAHNHPSGSTKPSKMDNTTTKELIEAGKLINIPIIDHIIVSYNQYYSYKEHEII